MPSVMHFALAAGAFFATAFATFDPTSKNNVVTYWGQGPNQQRLLTTCQNPNVDVINVAFVDVFPDQGAGGWPGTNFGNACWGDVYNNTAGEPTQLLHTCPYIGEDVIACQQTYGKKIFLSIGGGNPSNYYIKNALSGQKFANFLWAAFGPVSATQRNIPRPWGDAGVDGFDFDTENIMSPAPQSNYMTSGYAAMINHLKNDLFPKDTSKPYYISGAPQCVVPDEHFTAILKTAWFDFLWIQFYNTPQCSARAAISKSQGLGTYDISYATWTAAASLNKNVKMSIGLPASPSGTYDPSYYLNTSEAQKIVTRFYSQPRFGGIMLWETTYDQGNLICGSTYSTWMKKILNARSHGKGAVLTCKSSKRDVLELDEGSSDWSDEVATSSATANAAPAYVSESAHLSESTASAALVTMMGADGTRTAWTTETFTATDGAACSRTTDAASTAVRMPHSVSEKWSSAASSPASAAMAHTLLQSSTVSYMRGSTTASAAAYGTAVGSGGRSASSAYAVAYTGDASICGTSSVAIVLVGLAAALVL